MPVVPSEWAIPRAPANHWSWLCEMETPSDPEATLNATTCFIFIQLGTIHAVFPVLPLAQSGWPLCFECLRIILLDRNTKYLHWSGQRDGNTLSVCSYDDSRTDFSTWGLSQTTLKCSKIVLMNKQPSKMSCFHLFLFLKNLAWNLLTSCYCPSWSRLQMDTDVHVYTENRRRMTRIQNRWLPNE